MCSWRMFYLLLLGITPYPNELGRGSLRFVAHYSFGLDSAFSYIESGSASLCHHCTSLMQFVSDIATLKYTLYS